MKKLLLLFSRPKVAPLDKKEQERKELEEYVLENHPDMYPYLMQKYPTVSEVRHMTSEQVDKIAIHGTTAN